MYPPPRAAIASLVSKRGRRTYVGRVAYLSWGRSGPAGGLKEHLEAPPRRACPQGGVIPSEGIIGFLCAGGFAYIRKPVARGPGQKQRAGPGCCERREVGTGPATHRYAAPRRHGSTAALLVGKGRSVGRKNNPLDPAPGESYMGSFPRPIGKRFPAGAKEGAGAP